MTAAKIADFHAHIYFDPAELEQAQSLASAVQERFGVSVGHFHPRPVGPHPRGSVQMTVPTDRFGDVATWLAVNRAGLEAGNIARPDIALALGKRHPRDFLLAIFGKEAEVHLFGMGGENRKMNAVAGIFCTKFRLQIIELGKGQVHVSPLGSGAGNG